MKEKLSKDKEEILSRMKKFEERGTEFFLEDRPCSPEEVAEMYFGENMIYMPDYIMNEKGEVVQIRYDKITDF